MPAARCHGNRRLNRAYRAFQSLEFRQHRRRRIDIVHLGVPSSRRRLPARLSKSAYSRCSGTSCRSAHAAIRLRVGAWPLRAFAHAGHRHHKAGRAKATLRTVAIDHGLLNWRSVPFTGRRHLTSVAGRCRSRSTLRPSPHARRQAETSVGCKNRSANSVTHRLAGRPTSTVQEPQSPSEQTIFVPDQSEAVAEKVA